MVLADLCQYLGDDWEPLAMRLGIGDQDIDIIKQEVHTSPQRASLAIKLWQNNLGIHATGNKLEKALREIGRDDVLDKCVRDMQVITDDIEKAVACVNLDQSGFDAHSTGKDSLLMDSFHQNQESGYLDDMSNSSTVGFLNSEQFDKYAGEEKQVTADFLSHETQLNTSDTNHSTNGWSSNDQKQLNENIGRWKQGKSIWHSPSLDGMHDDDGLISGGGVGGGGGGVCGSSTVCEGGLLSSDSEGGANDNSSLKRGAGKSRRTLGSSSGSDVALHEGNDLSDSDPGSDLIQESLPNLGSQVDMHRSVFILSIFSYNFYSNFNELFFHLSFFLFFIIGYGV
ncbi:hypothetical protein O3M35_007140 [Rhynocoris fuscipes]|uniref:Death domain-containing protein n=1 Tax=Rhynocoris fuscipes TaxID=488301 RepID=A0AAW1DFE1_9HEMI